MKTETDNDRLLPLLRAQLPRLDTRNDRRPSISDISPPDLKHKQHALLTRQNCLAGLLDGNLRGDQRNKPRHHYHYLHHHNSSRGYN